MERSDDDEGSMAKDHPSDNLSNEDPEFVEVDPTGRYGRYNEVLGKGAYKTVYKAFDELDGIEVAWNQVNIQDTLHNCGDMERLYSELHLLKMLKHQNIIKFCNSWVDTRCKNVNFITEIFTSGTLRQYRKKHKHVKLKAIKHWSRQILQGLVYLHSHDPPIIHRDLKCDNVFINGNSGEVKIGDLGLAVILSQAPAAHSVIGTPEFMAPELYEEHYNELVDIYSFGMCLLEILSFEYPYSECTNAAQIYKKVTSGKRPAALNKVKDPEVRKFVEKCLASASERLHAKELLMDPFLQIEEDREVTECCQSTKLDPYDDLKDLYPAIKEPSEREDAGKAYDRNQNKASEEGSSAKPSIISSENHVLESPRQKVGWKRNRDFRIKVKQQDEKKVLVRFRITSSKGGVRYIQFDFELETDTAMSVACEMVTELDLSDQDPTIIAGMIDAELVTLLPDWKPGCCLEEVGGDEKQQELVLENPEVQEIQADDLDVPSVTLGPADDLEVAPDSRTEVLVYGRFEEVGCNLAGSLHTQQGLDGLGSFSDFSSEHFEGGGSDLSVDASFDRLNAEISADHRFAAPNLEGVKADTRTEPSFALNKSSLLLPEEDSMKEFLPFPAPDHKLDGDVGPEELTVLVLQQKQEIELLQSKHNQELLDLKMHLNEEAHTSKDGLLSHKRLSMQFNNASVRSSTGNLGEPSEYIMNEIFPNTCKEGRFPSVMSMDKLDNYGPFTTEEVLKNLKLDDERTIDTHMQPESSSVQLTEKSELRLMSSQDSAASEDCKNAKEPGHVATLCNGKIITADKSSLTTKETGNSEGGLVSTTSGIANSGVNKSKDDLIFDSTCKTGASYVPLSTTESESKGLPSPEGVKTERALLSKRESYLEFYKAGLSQKDKMLATNDLVCKSSDFKDDDTEQVRKQLLQKSIAELEAKTLEGLSQSNSNYLVKSAGKNNAGASVYNSHSQVQPH